MNDFVMSVLIFAITAAVLYVVYRLLRGLFFGHHGAVQHCLTCGHEGRSAKVTRGSFLIEVVLWLCFIVPGLIYSLWRLSTRHEVCGNCGAATIVPPGSPVVVAAKLRASSAAAAVI